MQYGHKYNLDLSKKLIGIRSQSKICVSTISISNVNEFVKTITGTKSYARNHFDRKHLVFMR